MLTPPAPKIVEHAPFELMDRSYEGERKSIIEAAMGLRCTFFASTIDYVNNN